MTGLYLSGVFFLLLGALRFFDYAELPPGFMICISFVGFLLTIGSMTRSYYSNNGSLKWGLIAVIIFVAGFLPVWKMVDPKIIGYWSDGVTLLTLAFTMFILMMTRTRR